MKNPLTPTYRERERAPDNFDMEHNADLQMMLPDVDERVRAHEEALELLHGVVDGGYYCVEALQREAAFEGLRREPEFGAILERAEAGRAAAREAFLTRGGARWLRSAGSVAGTGSGCRT